MHPHVRAGSLDTLALLAGKGDSAALNALVREIQPFVRAVSRRIAANGDDADEITQDGMCVMLSALPSFAARAHFETWMRCILRSQASRKLRRRRPLPMSGLPSELDPDDGSAFSSAAEAGADVERALCMLSSDERAILVGHDVVGLSSEELASAAHVTVAALKSRLHRARTRIRRELGSPRSARASYLRRA